jgi:hypothetical protein
MCSCMPTQVRTCCQGSIPRLYSLLASFYADRQRSTYFKLREQQFMRLWCFTSPLHMRSLHTCTLALHIGRLRTCQKPCAILSMQFKQYYQNRHRFDTNLCGRRQQYHTAHNSLPLRRPAVHNQPVAALADTEYSCQIWCLNATTTLFNPSAVHQ